MSRDGRRPPSTRHGQVWLDWRHEAAKPPADPKPNGPRDKRPPRGPKQPTAPHPQNPDVIPDQRPGRVLATVAVLILLTRHRAKPSGHPLGRLGKRLAGRGGGVWDVPRDQPTPEGPPITGRPWTGARDNLPKETTR